MKATIRPSDTELAVQMTHHHEGYKVRAVRVFPLNELLPSKLKRLFWPADYDRNGEIKPNRGAKSKIPIL